MAIKNLLILLLSTLTLTSNNSFKTVVVEAESFDNYGGWVIDQQSIDQIGSSYLMAHGFGTPCNDALTNVSFSKKGEYHVWVRTRNWAPAENREESAGRFQLLINGIALDTIFGQGNTKWNWHYGGSINIKNKNAEIRLHDITGFNGRCDAIVFSTNPNLIRHQQKDDLAEWRKQIQGIKDEPEVLGDFDLVVVGGGVAGIATSVTASRQGLRIALIHNRPVLGGNNSSEIRVHMSSDLNLEPYPNLGVITREIDVENAEDHEEFGGYNDGAKLTIVTQEPNISLFLSTHATKAIVEENKIKAVIAKDIKNNKEYRFNGKLFVDCTGDGNLGFAAGADYNYGRESKSQTGEKFAPQKADSLLLGSTLHWTTKNEGKNVKFPDCPWALQFTEESCQVALHGAWNWETGFRHDMVNDTEYIRDHMLRAIYGNWAYQKNHYSQKGKYEDYSLQWVGYILGKRESRRLIGDVVYSQNDIINNTQYPDALVSSRWGIDIHYPDTINGKFFPGEEFRSYAHHELKNRHPIRSLPYRCFCSRNIDNLFMAGRCVSMTHIAHAMFRNQHTTGMMGEVVGAAASLCVKNDCMPGDIFNKKWDDMEALLENGL